MGYLDGSTITVDAIITKHGRRKLANGQSLAIRQFGLSDDGIDYQLWNVNHPSGSSYYGEAINNLPNVEAITADELVCRYNLYTGNRDDVYLPLLNINPTAVTLTRQGEEGRRNIDVTTYNWGQETYMWRILDISPLIVTAHTQDIGGSQHDFHPLQDIPTPVDVGPVTTLTLMAQPADQQYTTTVEIYGMSSGAVGYVTVTIENNIRVLQATTS